MKTKLAATLLIITLMACQSKEVDTTDNKKEKSTTKIKEKPLIEKKESANKVDTISGIDVSHYQGNVDWAEIKSTGMHFGIAKSTQGITYTDPDFHTNWKAIEQNGLYRGTYHFYVPEDDPIKQAEHFVNTIKDLGKHHIPPALDLEGSGIGDLTVEDYQKNVLLWLKYVEEKLDIRPIIYTNHPFGNQYLNGNSEFSEYELWLAEYGKEARVPEAWAKESWTGWQFTEHDTLKGVKGSVDESRFLSTILLTD